jgi:low affinity Fe/Cu permease
MHRPLYFIAEFFSRPPGFYILLAAALICAAVASSSLGTSIVSISGLALTGVVLIQNARDTAAMQAKLLWHSIRRAMRLLASSMGSLEDIDAELQNIETRATNGHGVDRAHPALVGMAAGKVSAWEIAL